MSLWYLNKWSVWPFPKCCLCWYQIKLRIYRISEHSTSSYRDLNDTAYAQLRQVLNQVSSNFTNSVNLDEVYITFINNWMPRYSCPRKESITISHNKLRREPWFTKDCPCPLAEWLERRAEEHMCPRCAGSKPARDKVITCQRLWKRERWYLYEDP